MRGPKPKRRTSYKIRVTYAYREGVDEVIPTARVNMNQD